MFAPFTSEEAAEAAGTLCDLAGVVGQRLDPDAVLAAEAMALLKVVATARKRLAAVEMALSARVSDSGQWKGEGDDTAADRIAKETGTSKRQAKDHLRTAKQAKENPQLDQALRQGDVSPEQAKAIGAAGEVDPDATTDLLALAEQGASLGDLHEEAERRRREAEGEAHKQRLRARAHAGRFARSWTKDEMLFLLLGVPVDVGAELLAHLDVEREHVVACARRDGTTGTYENRSADALVNLITGRSAAPPAAGREADGVRSGPTAPAGEHDERSPAPPAPSGTGTAQADAAPPPAQRSDAEVGHGGAAQQDLFGGSGAGQQHPGAAGRSAPPGRPPARGDTRGAPTSSPPRRRSGPPPKSQPSGRLVARLDLAHLWGARGDTTCEIAGVGTVSLEALRAALPEPWVQLVLTRGKDVLHVTNIGRGADLWQQAALDWTHRGRCSNVACSRTVQIQNDHRTPWTEEQVTELANLDPLCAPDHRRKTHQGWALVSGAGRRAFVGPDDPRHPGNQHLARTG